MTWLNKAFLILVMTPCCRLIALQIGHDVPFFASGIMELALNPFAREDSSGMYSQEESLSCIGAVRDSNEARADFHNFVEMFTCMISTDRHKWYVTLGHRSIASFQFSPYLWVLSLQCVHICYVALPESPVFDPVHDKEELAKSFPSFEMKVKISIPRGSYQVDNRFHAM